MLLFTLTLSISFIKFSAIILIGKSVFDSVQDAKLKIILMILVGYVVTRVLKHNNGSPNSASFNCKTEINLLTS